MLPNIRFTSAMLPASLRAPAAVRVLKSRAVLSPCLRNQENTIPSTRGEIGKEEGGEDGVFGMALVGTQRIVYIRRLSTTHICFSTPTQSPSSPRPS